MQSKNRRTQVKELGAVRSLDNAGLAKVNGGINKEQVRVRHIKGFIAQAHPNAPENRK